MKLSNRVRLSAALAAIPVTAALYLNFYDRPTQSTKRPNMTNLSPRLQPLFDKTKIVCFGHFVLEVPATAKIVYGPAEVEYPIVYYPGEGENVAQRVNEQLVLVQKDRDYLSDDSEFLGKDSLFGKVVNGALPGQKLVFGSRDHFSYSIDSFIPLGKR